jgi:LytS/YehU family sensor histidine kinase
MENQAKQAMMNPHFVFNALNSIQQYINENDRVSANKYLTKFSRLIRLNLNLVSKSLISLDEELEKLKLYIEIEQLRFGEKLQYEFIIDPQLESDIHQHSIHDIATLRGECHLARINGLAEGWKNLHPCKNPLRRIK